MSGFFSFKYYYINSSKLPCKNLPVKVHNAQSPILPLPDKKVPQKSLEATQCSGRFELSDFMTTKFSLSAKVTIREINIIVAGPSDRQTEVYMGGLNRIESKSK